jgi:hypothetical protein
VTPTAVDHAAGERLSIGYGYEYRKGIRLAGSGPSWPSTTSAILAQADFIRVYNHNFWF